MAVDIKYAKAYDAGRLNEECSWKKGWDDEDAKIKADAEINASIREYDVLVGGDRRRGGCS